MTSQHAAAMRMAARRWEVIGLLGPDDGGPDGQGDGQDRPVVSEHGCGVLSVTETVGSVSYADVMRDAEKLQDELRLMSVVRSAIRSEGGRPSSEVVDRLLDELIEMAMIVGRPT
jgi:hypothetical protein